MSEGLRSWEYPGRGTPLLGTDRQSSWCQYTLRCSSRLDCRSPKRSGAVGFRPQCGESRPDKSTASGGNRIRSARLQRAQKAKGPIVEDVLQNRCTNEIFAIRHEAEITQVTNIARRRGAIQLQVRKRIAGFGEAIEVLAG